MKVRISIGWRGSPWGELNSNFGFLTNALVDTHKRMKFIIIRPTSVYAFDINAKTMRQMRSLTCIVLSI
jgi:hypothetical protein